MSKQSRSSPDKQRALTLLQLGQTDAALQLLAAVTSSDPKDAEAWYRQGIILWERGNVVEAEPCFRRVVKLRPDLEYGHYNLALVLERQDRLAEAIESYRRAIRRKPDFVEAIHNLGLLLALEDRFDEAQEVLAQGLKLYPGHSRLTAVRAEAYERRGETHKAHETLQPLLADTAPLTVEAALTLSRFCKRVGACDKAIDMHRRLLEHGGPELSRHERLNLHLSLGQLLDAAGRYDEAFAHFREGNALKDVHFDPQGLIDQYAALRRVYTRDFLERAPRSSRPSSQLIFVIGMPRSGSTLVEQILDTHPLVTGMGEAMWLPQIAATVPDALGTTRPYPECMSELTATHADRLADRYHAQVQPRRGDAMRVTDKMLQNFEHLGLIALLFPEARIVHCRRHPLDTCLSAYFIHFRSRFPQSYDLHHLGIYYREYRRLMDHWQTVLPLPLLEIDYETLIAEQERVTRELLAFCDLPWHDDCLYFHKNRRSVGTASYEQVRRPLYRSSVGRWTHYDRYLGPLREALEDTLPP